MRVLLVEDDDRLAAALRDVLRAHGMVVDHVRTGHAAVERLSPDVDVVVLDLTLPDRDGFDVCRRIRRVRDVPVVMATARGDLTSRVHGLNLGADDYLVKPYDIRELVARLHAVVRRTRPAAPGVDHDEQDAAAGVPTTHGDLVIDLAGRSVMRQGEPIRLTPKEFDLLALLARCPGVVFRHEQIISEVWESSWDGCRRTLEVHIAAVRSKTGVPGLIETVRGVGYRVAVPR